MEESNLIKQSYDPLRVALNLNILDEPAAVKCFDCLIVLNIHFSEQMLNNFILKSKAIIITDGAANHLYNSSFRDITNIHSIVGDMDSISPEAEQYYKNSGVRIIKVDDQDTNDFQKAILLAESNGFKTLVTMGVLGGRIDHELCNINNIEKYTKSHGLRFVALGESSLMFMIKDGQKADITLSQLCQKKQAGIFCFGKSKTTTTGYKWNLDPSYSLEWGKFISSSNQIVGQSVSIHTEKQLFFTIQLSESKEQKQQRQSE